MCVCVCVCAHVCTFVVYACVNGGGNIEVKDKAVSMGKVYSRCNINN